MRYPSHHGRMNIDEYHWGKEAQTLRRCRGNNLNTFHHYAGIKRDSINDRPSLPRRYAGAGAFRGSSSSRSSSLSSTLPLSATSRTFLGPSRLCTIDAICVPRSPGLFFLAFSRGLEDVAALSQMNNRCIACAGSSEAGAHLFFFFFFGDFREGTPRASVLWWSRTRLRRLMLRFVFAGSLVSAKSAGVSERT